MKIIKPIFGKPRRKRFERVVAHSGDDEIELGVVTSFKSDAEWKEYCDGLIKAMDECADLPQEFGKRIQRVAEQAQGVAASTKPKPHLKLVRDNTPPRW